MTPVDVARAHDSFQRPLIVEYVDGHDWIVREAFTYVSPRIALTIPVGFQTDFASIPRFLWRWLSPTDKDIAKPAVIHDGIYRTPDLLFTRSQADTELREAMACVGASAFKRWAVYHAVRRFGGHSYKPRDSDAG